MFERFKSLFSGSDRKLDEKAIQEEPKTEYKIIYPTSPEDYRVASALTSAFSEVSRDRKQFLLDFEQVRSYYLVDAILGCFIDDALVRDASSNDVLGFRSADKKIQEELKKFEEKFDFDTLVRDIAYDFLCYGEYFLELSIEKDAGVVEILEPDDPMGIVGMYKNGIPFKFMSMKDGKLILSHPSTYAHFILSSDRIRTPVSALIGSFPEQIQLTGQLPKHVRVGKPLFYGCLSKVKELCLLEKLVPAIKVSSLTTSTIVSVEVPVNTEPAKAFDICRRYEDLFNKRIGLDRDLGELTVTDILTQAGRFKVIPTFQGRGQVANADIRSNSETSEVISSIDDTRRVICSTLGVPYELLFGGAPRVDTARNYVRYYRKIKSIQSSIASGLSQIVLAHMNNLKGFSGVTGRDFDIQFWNQSINIDELDKIDYSNTMITNISSVAGALRDLASLEDSGWVDVGKLLAWAKEKIAVDKSWDFIRSEKKEPAPTSDEEEY